MSKTIETDIQIRFADADSLGHINNVNLQHYFDTGKMDFYARVMGKAITVDRESIILVSTNTNYYAQTRLYDKVYVETSVEKIGTKSITFFQRLIDRNTGEVKSDCTTVGVGFDFETQSSIEIKEEWRRDLIDYLRKA